MTHARKHEPKPTRGASRPPRRIGAWLGTVLVLAAVLAGVRYFRSRPVEPAPRSTAPASATAPSSAGEPQSAAPEQRDALARLVGRWQRPDGGYVLEIRSIAGSGVIDAGYFNPRPIHVAQASATLAGGIPQVFVELRDVNYPGAVYRLALDAANDRLDGTYYQPAVQQTFPVSFSRMPR